MPICKMIAHGLDFLEVSYFWDLSNRCPSGDGVNSLHGSCRVGPQRVALIVKQDLEKMQAEVAESSEHVGQH